MSVLKKINILVANVQAQSIKALMKETLKPLVLIIIAMAGEEEAQKLVDFSDWSEDQLDQIPWRVERLKGFDGVLYLMDMHWRAWADASEACASGVYHGILPYRVGTRMGEMFLKIAIALGADEQEVRRIRWNFNVGIGTYRGRSPMDYIFAGLFK